MSHHAESRRRPRSKRNSSSWLTGTLLIAGLSIAGVYCIWGDAPLEKTWIQLGFGKQPEKSKSGSRQASAQVEHVDVVEATEFPSSHEDDPFLDVADNGSTERTPKMASLGGNHESPPPSQQPGTEKFLPVRRHNVAPGDSNPFENDAITEAELDERFNPETLERNSASATIRTAAFPDETQPAAANNDTSADFSRDPAEFTPNPPRPRLERTTAGDKAIQLLAGDDNPPRQSTRQIGKRPTRPNVPVSPAATNSGPGRLDVNAVQALIDQGNDVEAYQQLSEAYFRNAAQRPLIQKQLDEVAQRIYFSPQTPIEPPYEIQPGDQLRKIANKYQLSWQYLSRLNQVDAKKIRPGKKLKVFQGPFQARVDLSDFELTVLLNGQYVKRYPVGTGKMNTTPLGEFTVLEKLENPTYYGPDGMVLEPDDPQNPLGERWIDIGNSFGIHGTIEPDSIGKSESAGCVRMRNEDVAEVYDLLTVGSSVRIQR